MAATAPLEVPKSDLSPQTIVEDLETNPTSDDLLQQLAAIVQGDAAIATFACGGSVPVSSCIATSKDMGKATADASRLQIRFDGGKTRFPMTAENGDVLDQLLKACQPASFGWNGKEVIDETYRMAGKLDRSDFSTDFAPKYDPRRSEYRGGAQRCKSRAVQA